MSKTRILFFFVAFTALCLGGLLLLQLDFTGKPMWTVKTTIAKVVGATMSVCGVASTTEGSNIHFRGHTIQIIDECTGVYATILLTSFIIAFPHRWSRKLKALLIALAFITVTNLLRLVALGLLMHGAPTIAKFAHDYLWQVIWGAALVFFAFVFARGETAPIPSTAG